VAPGSLDLAAQIQQIARAAGEGLSVDPSWLVGITAVAVRTLHQVGLSTPADRAAVGRRTPVIGDAGDAPDRILTRRMKDHSPGLFGFLRGRRRTWPVTFDERPPRRSFPLIDSQHLTTAAALDTRDYRSIDPRCTEGPIPVQCRSCSCGTCWVGILAGADRLSPVEDRERVTISALGYVTTTEAQPVVRLACMAEAHGSVTLVIPPWNGQIGIRLDRSLRDP
jgi:ferredoxin